MLAPLPHVNDMTYAPYSLDNPNLHPSVREAFTTEVEFRSVESGKAYSRNTLTSQTYYENDWNWIHLAEDRRRR